MATLLTNWEPPFEIIIPFVFLLLLYLLYLLSFIGTTSTTDFLEGKLSSNIFVYKTSGGPYSRVGPQFQAMGEFMAKYGFETSKTPMAGIYYDDPETTDVAPRYAFGFLVNQKDTVSRKRLEQVDAGDAKDWRLLEIKATTTIVTCVPMAWSAASSAKISAMKTYSAFQRTSFESKSGTIEIYRTDNTTVETHFPQENFDQFSPQELDSFPASGTDKKKVQ